ncbi:hypothetical protein TNCV_834131 [Trichonephila clavipes]|nr:hypothetical protein TNCV_834131 [Trichonephila clavipes]
MVLKKQKVIPERRSAKTTPATSRDGSQPAASEEPPGVTDMELPLPTTPQASLPGSPEKAGPIYKNCKKLLEIADLIDTYSMIPETSKNIVQGALDHGITDPNTPLIRMESSYMELTNTRLQKAVSEYASLPPCDNPNCTRHNPNNTPAKNNSPVPSPPLTPIPTKRKENAEENDVPEAPLETVVQAHKSLESTSPIPNSTSHIPKLPPPIMLQITNDLRYHLQTLNEKMPALRTKTSGKYIKLYTDTQPQHDTLNQLLDDLKYPFYTFTPKHERPIKVVIKGLP